MPIKAIEPRTHTTHAAPPQEPWQPAQSVQPERLLRLQEVMRMTGTCKTYIYDNGKKGSFPKGIKLSYHVTVWRLSEIEAWIADVVTNGQRV